MRMALGAGNRGSDTMMRAAAAHNAVLLVLSTNGVVILRQRNGSVTPSACLQRLLVGLQQLHQCVHEMNAKIELPGALLPNRPELEGGRKRRRGSGGSSSQHC